MYAEKLIEQTLDKLNPLTNIVRDSVEGVSEARLSLQDQSEIIRSSMEGLSGDIKNSLSDLEPILDKLAKHTNSTRADGEQLDQLRIMMELCQSLENLNENLKLFKPKVRNRWFLDIRGKA